MVVPGVLWTASILGVELVLDVVEGGWLEEGEMDRYIVSPIAAQGVGGYRKHAATMSNCFYT